MTAGGRVESMQQLKVLIVAARSGWRFVSTHNFYSESHSNCSMMAMEGNRSLAVRRGGSL